MERSERGKRMAEFRVTLSDKQKAIEYFEQVSGHYDKTVGRGLLQRFRDRERQAVWDLLELLSPEAWLLDAGCGSGTYALGAKARGLRVSAMDASPGMVQSLRDKVDEAMVGDLETFAPARQYDRVVCAGVLDFVVDPETSFRNLCAAVAPGGRLVILCPRTGPGGLFYRVEKYFFGVRINLFRPAWLSQLAEEQGLKLVGLKRPLPTNMALAFDRLRAAAPDA